MPKLEVSLSIGFSRCMRHDVIEIDSDEWGACENDNDREDLIEQYATEWARNYIDIGAIVVE